MSLAGEVYNGPVQSTEKGSFIFQITEIEPRPFKDFADIKEQLEEDYLGTKADADAESRKDAFEDASKRCCGPAVA